MARERKSNIINNIFMPADPVFRIPQKLVDDQYLVDRAFRLYQAFETDRVEWMQRRVDYYLAWDDSLSPVYKGLWNGASNLHLPITESRCMGMHARILQSIFFVNPTFYIDPQEDMDEFRMKRIETKMKYILMRYTNYNKGVFNAIDDWAWDLVTEGIGILSRGWDIVIDKYLRVLPNDVEDLDLSSLFKDDISEEEFKEVVNKQKVLPYKEELAYRMKFNGPLLVAEDPMYILFKGMVVDSMDLDEHETIIKVHYYSKNDLLRFKANGYMDQEAIDNRLSFPPDIFGATDVTARMSAVHGMKDRMTGDRTVNSNYSAENAMQDGGLYEFLMLWDRVDESGNFGHANRLQYEIPTKTKELARWTYIDRLTATGKTPLHMCHLYKRPRRSKGKGIPEMLNNLNQAADILVNQSIDAGMMANNPMGAYRGGGVFDPNEFHIEPGLWLKTEDPNRDLRILAWPVNPNWSVPVQQLLDTQVGQLVSLGAESFGQIGSRVGPLRSRGGLNDLLSQGSMQLDVIMKRVNQCISQVWEGLYVDCVERMPESMKITVVGMDGVPAVGDDGNPIRTEVSKADLRARVHFGLYANSAQMNKQLQLESSLNMAQFLVQRAYLETGIVGKGELYEIAKEILDTSGKRRVDRFIKQPPEAGALTFEAEAIMLTQGIMPPISLADPEHEKKIARLQELLEMAPDSQEKQYGILHAAFEQLTQKAIEQHQTNLMILQQAMAMQNPTGQQVSPTMGLQGGQAPVETNVNAGQNEGSEPNISDTTINRGASEEGA